MQCWDEIQYDLSVILSLSKDQFCLLPRSQVALGNVLVGVNGIDPSISSG